MHSNKKIATKRHQIATGGKKSHRAPQLCRRRQKIAAECHLPAPDAKKTAQLANISGPATKKSPNLPQICCQRQKIAAECHLLAPDVKKIAKLASFFVHSTKKIAKPAVRAGRRL
ncbi:MAG: hypothetical protein MJE77_36950 [Proteobacteria bacterium]|nr:hypothetical protein [Pseudomonadota bacterium]